MSKFIRIQFEVHNIVVFGANTGCRASAWAALQDYLEQNAHMIQQAAEKQFPPSIGEINLRVRLVEI